VSGLFAFPARVDTTFEEVNLNIPQQLIRSVRIDKRSINETTRTVELAFSSELPYQRNWGIEILDHSIGAIRLDRLSDGGPLLLDHEASSHIGTIESVAIGADRIGRAVVRFGNSPRATEIFQDVKDGIRKHVSVAYQLHATILESQENGVETYRVTDWEPYEISLVAVPADHTVGIGRSHANTNSFLKGNKRMEHNDNEHVSRGQARGNAAGANAERERCTEITAYGSKFNAPDLARRAIETGTTVDEFRHQLIAKLGQSSALPTAELGANDIGLTSREIQNYSMLRAIRAQLPDADSNMKREAGFEIEVSRATQQKLGRASRGLSIPMEILRTPMRRDLTAGVSAQGGATVQTDILSGSFINLLRNAAKTIEAGATVLPELRGNIAVPRQTSGVNVSWVAEGSAGTEGQAAFDQVPMSPKSITAFSDFTRRLVLQSSIEMEAFVRGDLAAQVALGIDLAAINGSGTGNQPLGIMNIGGIGSIAGGVNGAAPTWDNLVDLETAPATSNTPAQRLGYMTNSKVKGKLKKTQKFAGTNGDSLWGMDNNIGGVASYATNQVPSNLTKGTSAGVCSAIIYGNWADLLIALWGGLDIVVDPYSQSTAGIIRVVAFQDCDVAVRYPTSFAAMRDALTT
jgi:HK97 family phage major capsid protein/HK97 family phage prohead protease